MIRLLSIGNSFSVDAHRNLHAICEGEGKEVLCCNYYIGGCSLERHCDCLRNGKADYTWYVNGAAQEHGVTLQSHILDEQWDIVTLQQASIRSGQPQSYIPYLQELAAWVHALHPQAKLYIHETWAYETDLKRDTYETIYHGSQKEMYARLKDAYTMAAQLIGAGFIPVGDVIQYLREREPLFDYAKTGISLNRDGAHLSFPYGCYAAGLTWYAKLFADADEDIRQSDFVPELTPPRDENGEPVKDFAADPELIRAIRNAVYAVVSEKTQCEE